VTQKELDQWFLGITRYAEELLQMGWCDAVVMGRPFLADPELPNKAREGRLADIRPCMNCWCAV
jgi:2,4-dienoyl-CoA reductase-like NADH-dependent reductase (Old Yellow Enzyme family)